MKSYKYHVALILLFTVFTAMLLPATPAQAVSINDITGSSSTQSGGSSGGILNILLALLLGNFIGNANNSGADALSAVLGAATGSKTTNDVVITGTKGSEIVKSAQKYMGVPYVWGGSTPAGWDCSGFTQYVMKENGISIPRTADEQFNTGATVDKRDLKIGDLVFFTTYKPGASHVGFYMGNGKFIHASSAAKEVTVSSLDENYYTEHYIGARRYTQ